MTEQSPEGETHDHDHDHVHQEDEQLTYAVPTDVALRAYEHEVGELNKINFQLRTQVRFQAEIIQYLTEQLELAAFDDNQTDV
jgi:hypothetical protein